MKSKESLDKRRKKESTSNAIYWLCKCDCGNEKVVSGTSLKHGSTKTCGNCIIKEKLKKENKEIIMNEIKRKDGEFYDKWCKS